MANTYNLSVVIDLHALPGSQNGFDHSGKIGKAHWFRHAENRQKTIEVLKKIAIRYKDHQRFWGLQLINEPKVGIFQFKLRTFYHQAYQQLSAILTPHTRIIFSDAFSPRLFSGWLPRQPITTVMDVHKYQMTTLMAQHFSIAWYMKRLQRYRPLLARLSRRQPIIIGEWSGALRQSTYDRVPVAQHAQLTRDYIAQQLQTFDDVAGWFYWSYKTEQPGVWDFKSQVEAGIILVK